MHLTSYLLFIYLFNCLFDWSSTYLLLFFFSFVFACFCFVFSVNLFRIATIKSKRFEQFNIIFLMSGK